MARNGRLSTNNAELALSALGADVALKAKEVIKSGGETILTDAKAKIHSISGKLSASGKLKINKNGTIVSVIFDTKSDDGYGYSKIVEFRPGHEHPFLYNSYDEHRDKIKSDVIESIRNAVNAHAIP